MTLAYISSIPPLYSWHLGATSKIWTWWSQPWSHWSEVGEWVMMPFLNGGSLKDLIAKCSDNDGCRCDLHSCPCQGRVAWRRGCRSHRSTESTVNFTHGSCASSVLCLGNIWELLSPCVAEHTVVSLWTKSWGDGGWVQMGPAAVPW